MFDRLLETSFCLLCYCSVPLCLCGNPVLDCCNQPRQQRAATWNVIDQDVLMCRMCAVAIEAQTIQDRCAHRRGEVSVGGASDLRLAQFIVERRGNPARVFVKRQHFVCALEWRPVYSAAHD